MEGLEGEWTVRLKPEPTYTGQAEGQWLNKFDKENVNVTTASANKIVASRSLHSS